MKKNYHPSFENHIEDGYEIIECKILRILSEEEALSLRALPKGVSVGVVVIIPRLNGNKVEVMTITEKNTRDVNVSRKVKLPSGGAMPGEHPFAAAKREARAETGYEIDDLILACAGEYSTTVEGETHYKVFVIAKNHDHVSEPVYDGTDQVMSVNWRPFTEMAEMVPDGQKTGLQPAVDKMSSFGKDYYYAIGNTRTAKQFVEGPYSTYRKKIW